MFDCSSTMVEYHGRQAKSARKVKLLLWTHVCGDSLMRAFCKALCCARRFTSSDM